MVCQHTWGNMFLGPVSSTSIQNKSVHVNYLKQICLYDYIIRSSTPVFWFEFVGQVPATEWNIIIQTGHETVTVTSPLMPTLKEEVRPPLPFANLKALQLWFLICYASLWDLEERQTLTICFVFPPFLLCSLSKIRMATVEAFPGNEIPNIRSDPEAAQRVSALVEKLCEDGCTIKSINFGRGICIFLSKSAER